jgi:N-acyl-D-amino-acid deacylase
MINQARASGSDVTLDTYPYLPGATTLAALLPSWASAGGPVETLIRLNDAHTRQKIQQDMEKGCDGGHGLPVDWSTLQVGTVFPLHINCSSVLQPLYDASLQE